MLNLKNNCYCLMIIAVMLSALRCPAPIKDESDSSYSTKIKKYSSYNKKKKSSSSYKKKTSRFQFKDLDEMIKEHKKKQKKDYILVIEPRKKSKSTKAKYKKSNKYASKRKNRTSRLREASQVVIITDPSKITSSLAAPKL